MKIETTTPKWLMELRGNLQTAIAGNARAGGAMVYFQNSKGFWKPANVLLVELRDALDLIEEIEKSMRELNGQALHKKVVLPGLRRTIELVEEGIEKKKESK